jgi:hypothetical protein
LSRPAGRSKHLFTNQDKSAKNAVSGHSPSVKKQLWKIRRFSRTANIKSFSAENIWVSASERGGYF